MTAIQKALEETIAQLVALRSETYATGDMALVLSPKLECELAIKFVETLGTTFDAMLLAVAEDINVGARGPYGRDKNEFSSIVTDGLCDLIFSIEKRRDEYRDAAE